MRQESASRDDGVVRDDPMAAFAAMLDFWRMAAFDLPIACALQMNCAFRRMVEHQSEAFARLAQSRSVDEIAAAQAELVDAALETYEENAAALARDVAVTLETARAG